jgi:hypothetical protein
MGEGVVVVGSCAGKSALAHWFRGTCLGDCVGFSCTGDCRVAEGLQTLGLHDAWGVVAEECG